MASKSDLDSLLDELIREARNSAHPDDDGRSGPWWIADEIRRLFNELA